MEATGVFGLCSLSIRVAIRYMEVMKAAKASIMNETGRCSSSNLCHTSYKNSICPIHLTREVQAGVSDVFTTASWELIDLQLNKQLSAADTYVK